MKLSTRTKISKVSTKDFEKFLTQQGLIGTIIGTYSEDYFAYICYILPSDTEAEAVATILTLQYGSIEAAYRLLTRNGHLK